ncbi:MAG: phosphatase PAP2 family protein [Candidatus Solibacter usitatus]|nr:phosphatase PAP2 family protein [Candidatus Solibacter usitatus]
MTRARAVSILSAPDYQLMRRVNRWRAPRWVRWWSIGATRAGDGWLWSLCGVALLASHDADRYAAIVAGLLAAAMGIVVFRVLKKAVGRKRPCVHEPHCWATLLPPDQFSFPSGHSISAFAVAVSLGYFYPPLLAGLLFCAASIAISRILLGLHFLTDVLAGSALGVALGYSAALLIR